MKEHMQEMHPGLSTEVLKEIYMKAVMVQMEQCKVKTSI
jgi:hypothetical protein